MKKDSLTYGEYAEYHSQRRKRVKTTEPIVSTNNELMPFEANSDLVRQIPYAIRGLIFELNEVEFGRFKTLFSTLEILKDPAVKSTVKITAMADIFSILEVRNERKYQQIVKMCTNFNEFSDLCEDDKISLLKSNVTEIFFLLTVMYFDFEDEFWTIVIDNESAFKIPLTFLKAGKWGLYDAHRRFMMNLKQEYDSDVNLIDILTAILLFNPMGKDLVYKDSVKFQQKTYIYLLQRYLEIKHNSKSESETRFVRLMNCLQELFAVIPLHINNYIAAETPTKKPGPLIKELLNA
ncbi:unnamed protein product [Medioppia subpectinata]|uniref:NR LBD domain-containing protein n=1 Tax=Medioppia subpectinata TaxID=1979941 RepID=A0A7R9PU72_9ACAR|nr:unnamed protein product [Medioppia subpectinata]CAG2101225.1 unnamed protein product [Medioppia subpectinata]